MEKREPLNIYDLKAIRDRIKEARLLSPSEITPEAHKRVLDDAYALFIEVYHRMCDDVSQKLIERMLND